MLDKVISNPDMIQTMVFVSNATKIETAMLKYIANDFLIFQKQQ